MDILLVRVEPSLVSVKGHLALSEWGRFGLEEGLFLTLVKVGKFFLVGGAIFLVRVEGCFASSEWGRFCLSEGNFPLAAFKAASPCRSGEDFPFWS